MKSSKSIMRLTGPPPIPVNQDDLVPVGVTFHRESIEPLVSYLRKHGIELFCEGSGAAGYEFEILKADAERGRELLRQHTAGTGEYFRFSVYDPDDPKFRSGNRYTRVLALFGGPEKT